MVRPDHVFPVKQYMKTWCIFDVVLMVSEWFAQIMSSQSNASVVRVTRVMGYIRCSRLLRLVKIPNVWKLVEDQFSTHLQQLAFSAIKTIIAFCILVHLITCAWYAIGVESPTGWTSYDVAAREDNSLLFWYFASSRWVLAQINGRTDINDRRNMQERLFTCIVAVVFAVIFMSIFLSSMTATILQLNELSKKSSESRRLINEYLQQHRVSLNLVASVKRQMAANTAVKILRESTKREQLVLSQLPEHLQFDLLYEIRAPVLVWHAFFRELDLAFPRVARHICLAAVRPAIAHHNQDVFDVGDPCSRMLFADKGWMMYFQYDIQTEQQRKSEASFCLARMATKTGKLQPEQGVVSEWKVYPGMWLSEGALWIEWENHGRLMANEDSLLMAIDAGDLAYTLLAYRDAYAMSAIYARSFVDVLNKS